MLKVTLTDYTGVPDPWYAARKLIIAKNTRLSRSENMVAKVRAMGVNELILELNYISNTIRSSWEFVNYTFKIEGISRATCDQMVRTRVGVSFAVMTMRSVKQSDFNYVVPKSVTEKGMEDYFDFIMKTLSSAYQTLLDAGIPSQDARSVIPMAAESPLTAQYNLRALADVVGKRENLRAQGEYADVVQAMTEKVLEVHPWVRPFLYPERKSTPRLDALLKKELGDGTPFDKPELAEALKELDKVKGTWG